MKKVFLTLSVFVLSQTALHAQAYEQGWGHSYFSTTHQGWGQSEIAPEISSRFSDQKVIAIIDSAKDDVQYYYATNGEVMGARMAHALKVIKEIAPELNEAEQLALLGF